MITTTEAYFEIYERSIFLISDDCPYTPRPLTEISYVPRSCWDSEDGECEYLIRIRNGTKKTLVYCSSPEWNAPHGKE